LDAQNAVLVDEVSVTPGATTPASGVCLLAIVTVAAAFVPARRAKQLDPAITLRRE
jgi:ABC-type lipoprotein release transport system permease subunit